MRRVLIDAETGKKVIFKGNHSLFWIKMEYWGPIFMVLGLIILAQNLTREGIFVVANIFLGLIGLTSLAFYTLQIIKQNSPEKVFETSKTPTQPKSNYSQIFEEKEKAIQEILEKKDDDVSRFMPK